MKKLLMNILERGMGLSPKVPTDAFKKYVYRTKSRANVFSIKHESSNSELEASVPSRAPFILC